MVETPIHIVKDIGRKAADDVSAAMNRNLAIVDGLEAQLAVSAYAAATAIGWAGQSGTLNNQMQTTLFRSNSYSIFCVQWSWGR